MRGTKLWLFILLFPLFADSEYIDMYDRGIDAYRNDNFELAIQIFEGIVDGGRFSPELFYNLGNAYFRAENIPGAVWAYESCLRNDPNNKDAKYNLSLANVRVPDRVEVPEAPFYLQFYNILKALFSVQEWIFVTALLFLIFNILMAFRKIFKLTGIQRLENLLLFATVLAVLISSHSLWSAQGIQHAVVLPENITALSAPDDNSTQLFEIHAGLKVSITNESKSWTQIELLDGKVGWLPTSTLRPIL